MDRSTIHIVTGQKSWDQVKRDGASAAEAYAKPFMDLKGEDYRTMLTMTEQESHDAGLNDVGATMRVVDTAGALFGGASLVKNGIKVLKGGGKKPSHGDGAKGGVPHGHGDGPDGSSGGVMKDGKLKTNAAIMPSSLAELGERISQALGKMSTGAAASVPWRVRLMHSVDGRTFMVIVKKDNHMFSDTGGNRGKDGGSGSSKGSLNTSHGDSKETSMSSKDGNTERTGKDAQTPRTGPEWDEYFRSKYGEENVDWKTSSEHKLYSDKYIPYTSKIRPNSIITKPSLPKDGKPEGNYAEIPPKGDRGLERQNESANVLAEQGYRTVMLDELPNGNGFDGNGYGINPNKSPDFIIEGQVFDCYAPISTNLNTILKMLRDKTTNQARRIVLNLNDYPFEKRTELIEFILSQTHKDLKYLNELLVIEGRQVTRTYWRYE